MEIKEETNKLEIANNIDNLFEFNHKSLEEILLIYSNNNDNSISLDDIYYYIYHLKQNNGAYGKYSDKFKNLYKGQKYEYHKNLFRKKCKKYNINDNKQLIKYVKINNLMKNKEDINSYIVIPDKYIDQILKVFHKSNGHKGYKYLVNNILKEGYYFENIYKKCNEYIKNCIICTQQKKIYLKNQQ